MNGGRRNWRRQKGGYTLNGPKRHEITTVRSPERKKASGIGGDRQGRNTPNTPEGTISPRFGSLNGRKRPEAAVIDTKWHTKHTYKTYYTTNRWPPRSRAGGTDGSKGKYAYANIRENLVEGGVKS